ncbi:alpha/beta fold hydrolase [Lignipirellula cremea]|uniref:alpha/beta fold hydrolase n=1 Tax=Lignipirellula cremea TaxID=2528010 RepID=UPI0018D22736|nr:alpha/beta hydrolase [Lignipirellula cremea]
MTLKDGARIAYAVRPGTGPTLVLIPGSFESLESWQAVVESLDHDLQVVVVELRGHGESWPPPNAQTGTIEQLADDVLEVLQAADLKSCYLGGHSIGGMVAIECAGRQPQRLKGVIAIEGWTHNAVLRDAFQGNTEGTLSAAQKSRKLELREPTTKRWTAEQRSSFAQIWTKWNGKPILEQTSLPVLELWGDRGGERPDRDKMQIPDRPNIRLTWVTGASHFLPLEKPKETAHAVQAFIRKVEGKQR